MKKLVALFIFLNLTFYAQTNVSGIIASDITWTTAGSPYIVTGNILVNAGVKLTINPGVTVKFNSLRALQINGELNARGTANNRIEFTSNTASPAAGDWGYIYFTDTAVDAVYDGNGNYISGSIFEYCTIEYAGGSSVANNATIRIESSNPFINYSVIRKSNSDGIRAVNINNINCRISNSKIEYNNGYGIYNEGNLYLYKDSINSNQSNGIQGNFVDIKNSLLASNLSAGLQCGSFNVSNSVFLSNSTACIQGGAGIIEKNLFSDNLSHALVGIGGESQITENLIINNRGIGINTSWMTGSIRKNIIIGNNNGLICFRSNCSITNNIIVNNHSIGSDYAGGVYSESGNVTNNIIINNSHEKYSSFAGTAINFTDNLIYKNTANGTNLPSTIMSLSSWDYNTGSPFIFSNNNIIKNIATYSFNNQTNQNDGNINAINNFWDRTNSDSLAELIYDWFDDPTKSFVNYTPFLAQLNASAPISPPQNVKKTIASGGIRLLWSPNSETDIAGYKIYWGNSTGYSFSNSVDVGNITTYVLSGVSLTDSIAVTAYDRSRDGNDDMYDGNESWFSEAEISSITITSPNGGENWLIGSSHNIIWSSENITNVKIEYSSNNGSSWNTVIASTPASSDSYAWTIPNLPSTQCIVRISDAINPLLTDMSDANFTITFPSVSLVSPNGSETWQAASTQNITWTSSGVTDVKFEFTTNNGTNWSTIIATTPANSGSYAWTIPNTPSTQCKIRATDVNNAALFDISDTTFTISDGNWIVYNTSNSNLPHNSIKAIAVDNAGVKWIGTENGLAKYDGTSWTIYTTANSSLPYNYVSAIAVDGAGNKWIGTFSRYLAKFDNVNWTVYNTNDWGLPLGAIQALAIDASGNKWIGTSEGLAKFDGTTGTIYTPSNSGLPYKAVQSIAIDEQGNKWIGTLDSGLVKFDGTNWTIYKTSNSQIPNNQVHAIAVSRYGNKWLGTTGGFAKYDGSNWNVYDRSANYLDNWVFAAAIDNSGNKWTGSMGGVGVYDGANWTSYSTTNSGLPDSRINAIAIDGSENKWFGTNAGGVAVLKAGTTISKTLALLAPNGSESWQAGTIHNITWTNLNVTNVKLEYTTDDGTSWSTIIASTLASSGSYAWTIPSGSSSTCKVRISDASNSDLTDKSDNVFTLIKVVALPTNLTASSGNKQVSLKWNRNSETDLRVYRIYGGTSANPTTKVDSVNYTDTTKTIFNLTNDIKYYYRITAVDSFGNESGFSNEVSATPAPKTYTVKTDGLGNFTSIQSAINAAGSGDTIVVYGGTYYENINFIGKDIILRSASGALNTTINGNQAGSCVSFISGETSAALIDGFTITNGSGTLVSGVQRFGGGIYCYNGSNPTIKNCIITGNSADAGSGGGIECWYASATIENCIIKNNSNHGISNAFGNGVLVINCLIYSNYANDNGGGINTAGGSSPTIINSTIVKNDSYFHTNSGIYAISGGTVINSIVRDNTGIDATIAQGATSVTYSNIDGGFAGTGNIDVDPLFVDPVNNNYHLTNVSPCIGAATSTNAPSKDIEGNPRPNPTRTNPDMGAYENALAIPNSPLVLNRPNSSDIWQVGSKQNITWTSTGVSNIKIEYRTLFSETYRVLIDSLNAADGSASIFVPNPSTNAFRIKISSLDNPNIFAESDSLTTTTPPDLWEPILSVPDPQSINDICIVSPSEGWVAGLYLKKTTNMGNTWIDVNPGVAAPFWALHFMNKDTGMVCASGPSTTVPYTFNAGTVWKPFEFSYSEVYIKNFSFPNKSLGFVTNGNRIFKGGFNSWTFVYDFGVVNTTGYVEFPTLEKGFFSGVESGSGHGVIYSSTNQGTSWTKIFETTNHESVSSSSFLNPDTGVVVGPQIYLTTNSGNTWFPAKIWGKAYFNRVKMINTELAYAVGHDLKGKGIVFESTDMGENWYCVSELGVESIWSDYFIKKISVYDSSNIWISNLKTVFKKKQIVGTLTLTKPNGGESFVVGTVDTIKWTSTNITNVKLEYTTNSGTDWTTIIASTPASSNRYAWLIPTVSSANCKVRISDDTNNLIADTSDNVFAINYVNGYDSISYGGKIYHTVKIGNQTWLKENLDIGTMIQVNANPSNNGTIEKYCYDNNPANCDTYGGLYQWNEAMAYSTTPGTKGICPTGWHLPTITEFQILTATVNSNGNSLKAVGQGTGSGAGTNTSGFSALLAGSRYLGNFITLGNTANFWSSTIHSTSISRYTFLSGGGNSITEAYTDANDNGFSVRCIKDESPVASLQIVFPNGGESFTAGTVDTIKWTSTVVTNVKLEYTTNNGTNWSTIISSTPASNSSYAWVIPTVSSANCKVRISDDTNNLIADTSDNVFAINYVNGYDSISYGGKIYHTVKIGNQTWLKENLDIGTMIQGTANPSDNGNIEKYCYDNLPANCDTYGGLYQWNEAMSYSTTPGTKGICPTGWHVPTITEYNSLAVFVNSDANALKAVAHGTGNGIGTNTSGFSALLGGKYSSANSFYGLIDDTEFWSSTLYSITVYAMRLQSHISNFDIPQTDLGANFGFSIRCLKDENPIASIQLIYPNGGENFTAGTVDTIKWTSSNVTNVKLEYTTNSGTDWSSIIASTPASGGSYAWTIPNTPSTQCKVKVSDVDNASIADTSGIFTISAPVQKITVTSPNGGERWRGNSSQQITWGIGSGKQSAVGKGQKVIGQESMVSEVDSKLSGKLKVKSGKLNLNTDNLELTTNNSIENVRIDYSTNNGVNWTTVANGVSAAQNSYTWLVPKVNSQNCKVRIVDETDTTIADTSDAVFEIYSPQITVTSPNGGEDWYIGTAHNITWTQSNTDTVKISYSTNQSSGWIPIAEMPATTGSYSWSIPSTVSLLCKVKISDKADSSFADSSNAYFTIAYAPPVHVVLSSPNGGENWKVGEVHNITWINTNVDTVKIELTTNNGTNWTTIKDSVKASLGTFAWTIPNSPSTQCNVRISDFKNNAVGDSSNAVFTIELVVQKTIAVTSPNGGENWKVGSSQNIVWTSENVNKFKLYYTFNGGTSWVVLGYASSSPFIWTLPNSPSSLCKVRIVDSTDASIGDTSNAVFTISNTTITVVYPNGGEELEVGTNVNITWQSSNVQNVAIEYSTTNKRTWSSISASVAASNQSISWTVPDAVSDSCFIRIKDVSDNSVADTSDAKFKIIPSSPPSLTLTSPVGNEQWKLGTKHFITWTKNKVTTVKIEFSSNDGSSWSTLTSSAIADSGKYEWTVPNSASAVCRIRISDEANSLLNSVSLLPFEIYYSEIVLTAPNGGEEWMVSETHAITWTSLHVNKVKVELTTDNGANWTVQKDSATASIENVTWVVPNIPATSTECKIRISDANDPTVSDVSEQVFTVKGLPKLQVISPKAGDVWEIGATQAITWYRENIEQIKIELSTNSGSDWMNITSSVQASDQSYNWEVQNYLSQNCLVKISDVANPSFSDTSDVFSIVAKVKPVVLTPNGGEKLTLGQAYDITWKLGSGKLLAPKVPSHKSGNTKGKLLSLETAATSNIRIQLSTDDGVSWAEIKNQIAVDSAKFTWTVSGEPSDNCFIKIVDINDASNFDLSDSAFVILDNNIPNILVSTNSLAFGNVYQDSTEIKQINITNTGTADLQIQSTSFYQTSSVYKVITFNQTIKPDTTRNVSISFKPTEIAGYADTLYVYHNAAGSPAKIVLSGSGIEVPKPIIEIAATTVTFDTTYIGSNNQKTITIDNEGTAPLIVSKISFDKVVFSSLQSSFTLGAGLRHILTMNFAPTSDSSYSGTLTIQHNAPGSPSQVSLTGQGKKHVPNIVLSSKEINFGVITIYTHTEVTLDINNSGTADLVVSNISSSNNSFTTNLTNFVIQPNSSRAVTLTFSPINATQYTGTLTIAHNAGTGVSTVSMAGAGYPVDVIVTRTISFGDITLSGNYRMIGLPGDSSISITKTVSGTQKNDWNAFYDNGVISANQSDYLKEYDGSAKFAFKPGNGFWVVSKNGLTVSASVKPVPLAADSTYSIPLQSNWNIISNPFEKSTSWTKIKQLNGLTTHPLYKWNGQNYDQVSEMTTYEGFYFYNTAGLTSLKIPYDANGTLRKFFKSREEYQLGEKGFSIDCRQEGIEKSSVYAGFNSKSSNDVDDYDYFMPPADFGEVSLVLQNDSLSTDYKKLLVEQRKEIGEGTQFDFTARNSGKQQVQLMINGIEFFPESETYLLDKQYNKFTNLKEKNIFTLPQQMGKRNYALLVGSQSFIQERKAAIIPTEYLLYQNFPNPFNPATTIAFGLPKESNVTLTLYNMLGEAVMKNELGNKASGYHELLLDLSSKTSGVYFYAIQANALDGSKNFREVKKMMLLK